MSASRGANQTCSATRRLLVLAIRGYRRWLSGRGPLRRVRCTFDHGHDTESCSAFGLRTVREAPSARVAIGRIQRRLRRCRDASLFALDAPDGTRALGWGADHDRPLAELHAELVADGELHAARTQVLSAREVAARWRGDLGDVIAVRTLRGGLLPHRPHLRRPPPLALVARAVAWRLVLAALIVASVAMLSPRVAMVIAVLALLPIASIGRGQLTRRARLRRQARAAALFDRPSPRDQPAASLANRFMVSAISGPRLHSTIPKPSM